MSKTAAPNKQTPVEAPKVEAPEAEAPKTEAPKTEAPKVEAPKVETFDWTTASEVTNVEYVRNPTKRIDVMKDTPGPIIAWLTAAYEKWTTEKAKNTKEDGTVKQFPLPFVARRFPSEAQAKEFKRLAVRFCRNRPDEDGNVTLESRRTIRIKESKDPAVVVYCVKEFQARETGDKV